MEILILICVLLNFSTLVYNKMLRNRWVFLGMFLLSIVFYVIGIVQALQPDSAYIVMTCWFYYLVTFFRFRKAFLKKYSREPIAERSGVDINHGEVKVANTFDNYFKTFIWIIPIMLTVLTKLIIDGILYIF